MERIMLVEDDQQIIANISQTLRKWQYEPVVVKDGQAVQLTPTEGAMLQILLRQNGQAIHVQVLLIFFFPLAGGLLNMLIAAPAVKKVLYEFSIYNSAMMLKVAFWVTVAVFAFYLAIYAITTRVYRRIDG